MNISLSTLCLSTVLAPLFGALMAGLFGKRIGCAGAHWVTILGVGISFIASWLMFDGLVIEHQPIFNEAFYTWGISGEVHFDIGFLLDRLSTTVALIVTGVSLLVHIYSIGYMAGDPGYQRFFSYMSLFTFAMLMLVLSNNFLQLYFGWEGVGLVSYLLIGFWFNKDSANIGSFKAFLVNRVGDMGFILGIAVILGYFNTLDYVNVFNAAPKMAQVTLTLLPGFSVSIMTLITILLFIGAMGKSAQMPLHVWLPESMEGPTPISALIHAATMVTAGVFMVARMSPLFELSETTLSLILIVGATGALLTGLIAFVQNDIKRVIAYSTLSQLGYMVVALGASAFSISIFHLMTHAYFKALLFLAAGSVIIAMHHEQDIRKMGGLGRYMPITYITFLIGALSMSAIPPFSGYYSKESIIEAVRLSTLPGAGYAYFCVLIGTFVTSFYIFRVFFLTFHTKRRIKNQNFPAESPLVICLPLIILAIPSVILGGLTIESVLSQPGLFGNGIVTLPQYNVVATLSEEFHGAGLMALGAIFKLPFWLAVLGIVTAWWFYIVRPEWPALIVQRMRLIYAILLNKYGFDEFYQIVFVKGTRQFSHWLFRTLDVKLIDDGIINGSGRMVGLFSRLLRKMQSGYLYDYGLIMIVGLLFLIFWLLR